MKTKRSGLEALMCALFLATVLVGCGGGDDGAGGGDSGDGDGPAASGDGDGGGEGDGDGDDGPSDGPSGGPGPGSPGNGPGGGPGQDGPSGDGPSEPDPKVDWEAWTIVPSPMYSAFDGEHDFAVPAYVNGIATELESWEAFPADAVSFAPWQSDDGSQVGVLITVESDEPEVLITASEGPVGGQATLYITKATPEQWEIGKDRYINGESYDPEALMNDPEFFANLPDLLENFEYDEDGNPVFTGVAADLGISLDNRCDTCHTSGAENFQVQHTPTQAARFSDEELVKIFTEGTKPEGVGYRALPEMYQNFYEIMHTWNVTEEQAQGLVIYLRSLTPEGQGDVLLPTGFYDTDDIDFSKLPASCDPDGDSFDIALCFIELPPICNPTNFMYNEEVCREMLGFDEEMMADDGS